MGKRFYQISFDLGMRPRAFIRELAEVGLSVGNQMVIVPDALESRIRELHEQLHPSAVPVTEAAPAETPAVVIPEGVPAELEPDAEVPAEAEAPAEAVAEPEAEVELPEVPVEEEAPVEEATEETEGAAPEEEEQPIRRPRKPLVPTLDPRAGRLVRDAPAGGIPGVTTPRAPRHRDVTPGGLTPSIPRTDRAPGARRESGRRAAPERYRGKRGKETFTMRKRGAPSKSRPAVPHARPTSIDVQIPITVKRFCELSGYKAAEVIKVLFKEHGMIITANSMLDRDTVELLALELEIDVKFVEQVTAEDTLLAEFDSEDDAKDLKRRPPVVTILGHVDHGKTTLLDKIRSTDVAAREAGGITQHIGASQVTLADGRKVTFLDTPGHEAFTQMRARGAQVTDVAILIVAADDGVMPQTVEAISHARAAGVEIVVAITKIDRDNARPERVKQQLSEHGIFVEGYGGDVSVFPVSGITGQGVQELLEHLALLADVEAEKFRANPKRRAQGVVIEAQNSPQRGIVATVLVQNGTLKKGDPILAGEAWGRVKALFDDKGQAVKTAGPSTPVEVIGLDQVPDAGSKLYAAVTTAEARKIAVARREKTRELEVAAHSKPTTVESLFGAIESGKVEEVNLVIKADVKGSLHPLRTVLERLGTDEVKPKIIHAAVGAVNESDIVLASASKALVIGFHVNVDAMARAKAKQEHVEIRTYKIIYDIEHDVRDLLEGRLAPEMEEVVQGHAEVLAIFTFSKIGNIAGCRVRDGMIRRDSSVRVLRSEQVVHEGRIASLRREKNAANEVREGLECGLTIEGWDALEIGDVVEAYTFEAKKRTLA